MEKRRLGSQRATVSLDATDIRLTRAEVEALEAEFPADQIVGERYAPPSMKYIDR